MLLATDSPPPHNFSIVESFRLLLSISLALLKASLQRQSVVSDRVWVRTFFGL
jgi:hypothetical protein